LLILTSGIGGLAWLIVFFLLGIVFDISSSYYDYSYRDGYYVRYITWLQDAAITMYVLGGIFNILNIALIVLGSVQINRLNSKEGPWEEVNGIPLEELCRHSQLTFQLQVQMQQPPPAYAAPIGTVVVSVNGSGSNDRRLSIESLAVHLDIPSLADALEMTKGVLWDQGGCFHAIEAERKFMRNLKTTFLIKMMG
jgi:hypothetical protein